MKKNRMNTRAGFSLIEMLAVIAILAIMGGLGFGAFMLVNKGAKIKQAEVMIENLSSSLENRANQPFSKDDLTELSDILEPGTRYPSGNGGLTSSKNLYILLSGDYNADGRVDDNRSPIFPEIDPEYKGKGKYVARNRTLIDPWQNAIRYEFPGTENNVEDGYDIWSAGPDGEFDTEDDVNNW